MRADGVGPELVAVTTTVDEIPAMKDQGQYIYAWVLRAGEHAGPPGEGAGGEAGEPLIKFNNGLYGGTPESLFKYSDDPKGMEAALYEAEIKPVIAALLGTFTSN